jgi:hypothetical protein
MMSQPFTVFQVSWLTKTVGNEHRRDSIVEHIFQVTKFLQDNGLVHRQLMQSSADITDDFELSSADLTDDGLAVMRAAYHKWLTKVDNGMSPEDWSLLEKALKKVRAS